MQGQERPLLVSHVPKCHCKSCGHGDIDGGVGECTPQGHVTGGGRGEAEGDQPTREARAETCPC